MGVIVLGFLLAGYRDARASRGVGRRGSKEVVSMNVRIQASMRVKGLHRLAAVVLGGA